MLFVMYGSSVFSSVFAITERSEMGLYDVCMLVRYASPRAPMCLRCLMLTLSGPVELFLHCFIAAWTCVVVSIMSVVCSLSAFLSMCLLVLCVLCLTVLVNCLLNASKESYLYHLKWYKTIFHGLRIKKTITILVNYTCLISVPVLLFRIESVNIHITRLNNFTTHEKSSWFMVD